MPLPGWNLLPHLRCRENPQPFRTTDWNGRHFSNLQNERSPPEPRFLPVTFCSRIAGMRASSTRSVLPTRQSRYRRAAAARTCGGSNPAYSSSSPSKRGGRSVSHRAPGPTRSERPRPLMGRRRSARTPDHRGQRRSPHSATRFAVPRGHHYRGAAVPAEHADQSDAWFASDGGTHAGSLRQPITAGVAAIGGPWWPAEPTTDHCTVRRKLNSEVRQSGQTGNGAPTPTLRPPPHALVPARNERAGELASMI